MKTSENESKNYSRIQFKLSFSCFHYVFGCVICIAHPYILQSGINVDSMFIHFFSRAYSVFHNSIASPVFPGNHGNHKN